MRATTMTALAWPIVTAASAIGQPASELAPNDTLRVGLLLSNPVLVTKKPDGTLAGVAVELGRLMRRNWERVIRR